MFRVSNYTNLNENTTINPVFVESTYPVSRPVLEYGYNRYYIQIYSKYSKILIDKYKGVDYSIIETLKSNKFLLELKKHNFTTDYVSLQLIEILYFFSKKDNLIINTNVEIDTNLISNIGKNIKFNNDKYDVFFYSKDTSHILTYNEISTFKTIYLNLLLGILNLKNNGIIAYEILETYSKQNITMIFILSMLFKKIYIYKSPTSSILEPNKFLILHGFNKSENNLKLIKSLYSNIKNSKNIIDIELNIKFDESFIRFIVNTNIEYGTNLYISKSKVINYLEEGNYYGNTYNKYIAEQNKNIDDYIQLLINLDNVNIKNNLILSNEYY